MGSRIERVDEPRLRADRGGDSEGQVLGELEGLEMVEDDGLLEPAPKLTRGAGEQQQGVAAQPGAHPRDGRGCAAERPGDLAVAGPGDLIAVYQSGAYGYSTSPHGFLSHPLPGQLLV